MLEIQKAPRADKMILGVPSLWRYELLDRLIASALAGSRVPDEILVVDNGGKYEAKESRVRVIYSGENLGVAASWNLLLRAGAWIISNDDVVFKQRTFEELAAALESGVPFVNGLGWALFGQRPEVVEKIGFYDERFFPAYYEDDDYEVRLIDAGIATRFPVLSEPVEHIGWASSRKREDGELRDPGEHHAIYRKNCQAFTEKWGGSTDQVKAEHRAKRALMEQTPVTAEAAPIEFKIFRPAFSPGSCYLLRDATEEASFIQHGGAPDARLIDWATQFIAHDETFVDVGAHVGTWAQHFALKCKQVIAFEPQRSTYDRLREGVRLSKLGNVVCHDVALGGQGEADLHVVSVNGGRATLRHRQELGAVIAVERVRCAQLDDFDLENVGLIKIDAEGFEIDILRGAVKLLEKHHPALLLKAWDHEWYSRERAELIAHVLGIGYGVVPIQGWPQMLLMEPKVKRRAPTPDRSHITVSDETSAKKPTVLPETAALVQALQATASLAPDRPLLGLVMIVKNEAKRIAQVLASYRPYIDAWTILDTGSTDGTQDLIRRDLAGIPGALHEEPFVDFATSRNRALDLHGTATVFSIMPNGDVLSGGADLVSFLDAHRRDLAGAYRVRIAPGHYYHPLVMRTGFGWRYKWRTHECAMGPNTGPAIPGVTVQRDRGARTDDEWRARWMRDLDLLNRDRQDDPNDPRPYFYLGQTHECLEQPAQALEMFKKRATMGGYFDEVYEAKFRIAKMMKKLDRPWAEIQQAYLEAFAHDPRRAEPLYAISEHWYDKEIHAVSRIFSVAAARMPKPPTDLFLDEDVYTWKAADRAAISSFYAGHKKDGRDFAEQAVSFRPDDERLRSNRAFYAQGASELFGSTVRGIDFTAEPGWHASNPSICLCGDRLRCVVRTVNYKLTNGNYVTSDGIIRTRNFLVDLDDKFSTLRTVEMVDRTGDPRTSFPVRGFEDARLFSWKGKWWATATVRDFTDHGRPEIALLEVDDDGAVVRAEPMRGPWNVHVQKNWMPLVDGDSAKFIYATSLDGDVGSTVIFDLVEASDPEARPRYSIQPPANATFDHGRLRGGSQAVRVDGGWIFCVHDVAFSGSNRIYTHRFALIDERLQLVSMTDPFYFEKLGIEFCAGLTLVDGKLVASYAVNDSSARLGIFEWGRIRRALRKDFVI
jgi:FkbM family methyltransferase